MQEQNQLMQPSMMACPPSLPERRVKPHPNQVLRCPRCDSFNTKFCYYNNYSLTQPRHFCKNCRRYWTKDGVLRNVPVGGGCRKNKRSKQRNAGQTTDISAARPFQAVSGTSISGETSSGTSAPTCSNNDVCSPNSSSPQNVMENIVPSGFLDLLVYGEEEPMSLPPFDVLRIPGPQQLTGIGNNNNNKTTISSTGDSSNLPRAVFVPDRSNTPMLNGLAPFDSPSLLEIAFPNAMALGTLHHQRYWANAMPHSIPSAIESSNSQTDSTVISTTGAESRNATNPNSLQWRSQYQQQDYHLPHHQDYRKWIGDVILPRASGRSTADQQQHISSSDGHATLYGKVCNNGQFGGHELPTQGEFEEARDELCHVNSVVFPDLSEQWRDTACFR
eukprot:c26864_g1_i2 orf=518-1684(-)